MAIITKISTQKVNGRYNIDLDGKFAFGAAESVVAKYGLLKGRQVDDCLIEEIKHADQVAQAYFKATKYLSGHLRTERQVRDKLVDMDLEQQVVDQAIANLKETGYINDRQYASAYVSTMINTSDKGPRVITNSLKKDGVDSLIIEEEISKFSGQALSDSALQTAEKLIRHYSRESVRNAENKVRTNMLAKGFSLDDINIAIGKLSLDADSNQEMEKLEAAADKIWNKYAKYGRQRPYKVKSYLYGKGYSLEMIDQVISQLQE
jgi:regulatory protein